MVFGAPGEIGDCVRRLVAVELKRACADVIIRLQLMGGKIVLEKMPKHDFVLLQRARVSLF